MIFRLKLFFFLIAICLADRGYAQTYTSEIPGGFRKMLVAEGIPSSEVYEVYQDRMGYLWLATDAGVCRYNGVSFTTFTTLNGLPDNTVFHVKEDSKGRIWVQTFTGAISYFEQNRFWNVPANDSLVKLYGNGRKTQYTFFIDNNDCVVIGGLYIGGCYRIHPEDGYTKLDPIKSPFKTLATRQLWTDSLGHLYAIGESFYEIEPSAMIYHNGHEVNIPIRYTMSVGVNMRILLTRDNRVLFTHRETLYVIDEDGNVSEHQFKGTIIGISENGSGEIWVNMLREGTLRFADGDFTKPGISYMTGYSVSYVLQDTEKGYWFSTIGKGLFYRAGLEFGYLTVNEDLPSNAIASMTPLGNGKILLGQAFSTVSMIATDKTGGATVVSNSLGDVREISVEMSGVFQGKLFCNADHTYLIDSAMHVVASSEPSRHLKGCCLHPGGDTLFGFSHSAFAWIDKEYRLVKTSLAPVRITSACYQENTLWLGGLNGLWVMHDTVPEYVGDKYPGLTVRIDDMVADDAGRLWIATRGDGVFVLDHDTVHHFDQKTGLSSNTCRSIALDAQGNVWIATNKGISVLSDYNRFNGRATIARYNRSDGLLSNEVNFIEVNEGTVWMAGPDGLWWVPANKLLVNLTPPPVYINAVIAGNDTLSVIDSIVLEYEDNRIRIICEGVSLRNASKISFRYRLSGSTEGWVHTQSREITFSNLDPGDYTFILYALNANGIPSTTPATLHVHVIRPFTKTYWFYALIVLGVCTLLFFIVRFRLNAIRGKASRRSSEDRRMAELRLSALRAQMNPHFIFNAINSIQHYILNSDSDKAYGYLAKFSKLIRLVLDQSQSNTITLKQELEMLGLYIELEQLRFDHPIAISLNVEESIDQSGIRLPGMLIQPYVENAIWHGLLPLKDRNGLLNISITEHKEKLLIVIEDNGIGREAAQDNHKEKERRSYGMLITDERLKLMGRSEFNVHLITIVDLADEAGKGLGTRVEITISLTNLQE